MYRDKHQNLDMFSALCRVPNSPLHPHISPTPASTHVFSPPHLIRCPPKCSITLVCTISVSPPGEHMCNLVESLVRRGCPCNGNQSGKPSCDIFVRFTLVLPLRNSTCVFRFGRGFPGGRCGQYLPPEPSVFMRAWMLWCVCVK